ncbi:hypothetical protein HCN44_007452 [Aphidius gifuensis]|uniref:DNA endonuclease activator Ctp1 C-terminal domain-containing protein n=1 Tax=Aphidius gifuensis TaxID=684658 RepID=A0A834XLM4_APHGI|nr:hypothetical protein HCN44_007452 [Aphidius gifuensis]
MTSLMSLNIPELHKELQHVHQKLSEREIIFNRGKKKIDEGIADIINSHQMPVYSKDFLDNYKKLLSIVENIKKEKTKIQSNDEINFDDFDDDLEMPEFEEDLNLNYRKKTNSIDSQQETPGIVESTQFEKIKNPTIIALEKNLNNLRKNNTLKTKINNSQSPSTSKQPSSQNNKLILNKTHADIKITNGKISRQTKLSFQSVKKQDINSLHNKKNVLDDDINPDDFDVDETFFEKPLTMEVQLSLNNNKKIPNVDDIIDVTPKNSMKKKSKLNIIKSVDEKKNLDTSIEDNIDDFNNSTTQLSLNKTKKSPSKNNEIDLFEDSNSSSFFTATESNKSPVKSTKVKTTKVPKKNVINKGFKVVAENVRFDSSSDDMDETYCPRAESLLKNNNKNLTSVNGKRKVNDVIETVKTKENIDINPLDIDPGDGWDTELSLEKWQTSTSPPKKKQQLNSYDFVPERKKASPKFACKGPVVRKKAERQKLNGWSCKDCEKWYENMDLDEKELQKRKNSCSRHRSKFNERYDTPPGFWDIGFSSPMESSQETL